MSVPSYRVLVVGDEGTGKTSWMKKTLRTNELSVRARLSTSAGELDIQLIESRTIEDNVDLIVSIYDVTRPETLRSALARSLPDVEVFVLGLKADLVGWSPPGTADILLDSVHNPDCGKLVLRHIAASLQGKDFDKTFVREIMIHDNRIEMIEEMINNLDRFVIAGKKYIQSYREGKSVTDEEELEFIEAAKRLGAPPQSFSL